VALRARKVILQVFLGAAPSHNSGQVPSVTVIFVFGAIEVLQRPHADWIPLLPKEQSDPVEKRVAQIPAYHW
jgi:hypothetical protein